MHFSDTKFLFSWENLIFFKNICSILDEAGKIKTLRKRGEVVIFGEQMQTIYVYVLIFCSISAFVLVIFGDIFHFDGALDPMLVVPWLSFTALFGYLGEIFFEGQHWLVLLGSVTISSILVFLLNFYILMPVRHSEASISISEKDMEGRVATVVTPIPVQGMGEIQFKSVTGSLSRPAALYDTQEEAIPRGAQVLIIEIKDRICYVTTYKSDLQI